jgi:thiosulfate dehydrogenase
MKTNGVKTNMIRFLFGLVLGVVMVPIAVLAWFAYGKVPVAVTDPPFPYERQLTSVPLDARIEHDRIDTHLQADEPTLIAGARVYGERCAVCHGLHGKPSSIGTDMFPGAPQLLEKHRSGNVVGVSDDPPSETYWKVANGIRLTGMPEFKTQLSDTEMWQVTLMLANADKPMPPAALDILRRTPPPPAEAPAPPTPPAQ